MNKKFTKLMAALALLTFLAVPMGMWGQTTHTIGWGTASGDAGTYTNFTATSGSVANILSFSTAKNSANNAPAYNASNNELRLYNASNGDGCSITITPSSGLTITQIVITATSGYTSDIKYSVNGGTATAATWSNNTCTISGIEASTSLMVQNVKTSTQQLRIKTIAVMYAVDGPVTYTVTYDCNGGTNGCPEDLTGLSPNTSITLANAPTKEHFNFEGWSDGTNTYDAGDSYTVNSHVTFTAQWESDGTVGEGSICFSSQSGCTVINNTSVTGDDDLGNTWTITTEGTTSFTNTSTAYSQVGSGNSPATSITFTTTFEDEVNVTNFSATFGGFNATRASVVLKVDNTEVGSGSLNGSADVTVSSSSAQTGTTLTVIVTPTAGGVKCYNISYTYEISTNPSLRITTPEELAYNATSGEIEYTINNPVATASVFASVPEGSWITLGTVGENSVPFTCTANTALSQRSETVTFVYVDGEQTLDTKTVTVTQAPAPDPTISAENVSIAYDDEDGTINYIINNPVDGGSLTASCDAEWIEVDDAAQTNAQGSIYFTCAPNSNFYAHSVTVTLTYTYANSKATVTKDVTVTQALDPQGVGSSAENAFTVSEAIDAIDEATTVSGAYAMGIVSNIVTPYSSSNNYITFDMIDEAGNDYYLRAYHCVGTDGADASEVAEGDIVVVYGNLMLYDNSIYEFASGCELVSLTRPASITVEPASVDAPAAGANGTLSVTYYEIESEAGVDIRWYNAAGEYLQNGYEWVSAQLDGNWNITYTINANAGEARTAYMRIYGMDAETNDVFSNLVTFTQAAPDIAFLPFNWAGGTSSELTALSGVSGNSLGDYAVANAPYRVQFNATNDYILINTNEQPAVVSVGIKKVGGAGSSSIVIQGSADGENFTDVQTFSNEGSQNATMTHITTNAFAATDRYVRIYFNKPSSGGANVGVGPITIRGIETYELTINGYGNDNTVKTGWNLIASPVASVTPSVENGFLTDTYDLYYFDQSQESEWVNYKDNEGHTNINPGFNLVSGKGYLYAHSGNGEVTLTFTGAPYLGNGVIALDYSEDNTDANMHGWNLIGNPFGTAATLNMPFFKMNSTGSGFTSQVVNSSVAAMEGVVVYAYDDEASQPITTATFTATRSHNEAVAMVNIEVESNLGAVMDNAIVNFNEGLQLPKFYFGSQNANVYIPQGNKEYAVVSSEAQGEMPVNFKAAENGTYTLIVNPEGVEMNYLHLIDNMTGADIDLLQTPSYTFSAATRDYESRFRLVFAASNSANADSEADNFAFFSNGSWIINNVGEATLQVVDVNGRILSTETVNGSVGTTINAASGVYMLRLINGENVKVQKIVVR